MKENELNFCFAGEFSPMKSKKFRNAGRGTKDKVDVPSRRQNREVETIYCKCSVFPSQVIEIMFLLKNTFFV